MTDKENNGVWITRVGIYKTEDEIIDAAFKIIDERERELQYKEKLLDIIKKENQQLKQELDKVKEEIEWWQKQFKDQWNRADELKTKLNVIAMCESVDKAHKKLLLSELSKVKGELERWTPDDEYEVRFYDRKYNICVGNMKPVDAVGFNVVVETNPPDDETFKEENKIDNFLDELGILEECEERAAKELKVLMKETIKEVVDELRNMSDEELEAELEKHKDGDIATALNELNEFSKSKYFRQVFEETNPAPEEECEHEFYEPFNNSKYVKIKFNDGVLHAPIELFNFCPKCGVNLREEECDE